MTTHEGYLLAMLIGACIGSILTLTLLPKGK